MGSLTRFFKQAIIAKWFNSSSQEEKDYSEVNDWPLNVDELELTYNTEDSYSKQWFYPRYDNGNIHEPVATRIFIDHVKPTSVVFDIGAHLGYFTCISAKLALKGQVHAFDVDPKCRQLIDKNVEHNALNNVTVHAVAASDSRETIAIPNQSKPNPGLIINTSSEEGSIEAMSVRIDDFIKQIRTSPDFIKIDVEGAELKVLKGMKELLTNQELIVLVEVHVYNLRKHFNSDYKEVIALLLDAGFTIENIDHRMNSSSFKPVDLQTKLKGNTMLLCRKSPF